MYQKGIVILFFFNFFIINLVDVPVASAQDSNKAYAKTVTSSEINKTFGNMVSQAKKAFDGGVTMLKGMGQGFGIVTGDYRYNYCVINDSSEPIFVAEERLTGLMGAEFSGEIKKGLVIGPNGNSNEEFYKSQLYISVWLCADSHEKEIKKYARSTTEWARWGAIAGTIAGMGVASPLTAALGAGLGGLAGSIATVETLKKYKIYEKDIYPWQNNDDKVYYYRAYTHKGILKGEYLDLVGTTSLFSGQFYNRSKNNVVLAFTKDENPYVVTLEPDTFSLLESSPQVDYSIRPPKNDHTRGFQFYNETVSDKNKIAFIPVSPDGIGNVVSTQKDTDKQIKFADLVIVGPKLYTYEIYDTIQGPEIGVQGLKIGHFDQPASGKIRDINPVVCHFWCKNAENVQIEAQKEQKADIKKDYNTIPFDSPEQIWITYKTADYVLQEKIAIGSVFDFYLIRPQLQEKKAYFYIVLLQTNDAVKAKKFLNRLHSGLIGQAAVYTDVTKEQIDKKTLLTMQPNKNGFFNDDQGVDASGITGAILLADYFMPQGVGTGPFYYELDPGMLQIDQFANCIWFDKKFYTKDEETGNAVLIDEVMKDLSEKLPKWIKQYELDQTSAKAALKNYLQEKANAGLFIDPQKSVHEKEFTQQGNLLYQTLIDGPISLKNYPIMLKSGMNWYTQTLGDKPLSWP